MEHNYGGVPLRLKLHDSFAEEWYDHDWDELPEVKHLRESRLKGGATVFAIGAHQGVVALMLAHVVGKAGRVIAVEAERHNAALAQANRDLNNARQVEVLRAVASDQPGVAYFVEGLNGHVRGRSDHVRGVATNAVTIDELSQRFGFPDVLYIDVEGYECQVLRGAKKTLGTRPDCFVEAHLGAGLEDFGSYQELLAYFDDGYEVMLADAVPGATAYDFLLASERPALKSRGFLLALDKNATPRSGVS